MNPISWIAERVITIVAQVIGGAVVTKAEAEALKHHVNTLGELEIEAKRHEDAGNPHLAEVLRSKSKRLATRTDFASLEASTFETPKLSADESPAKNIANGQAGKRKRGRPKKSANQALAAKTPGKDETQQ